MPKLRLAGDDGRSGRSYSTQIGNQGTKMTAFVMVHGALSGGWVWQRVARLLQSAGHAAYHPSLDGCGDRKGSMRADITVDTHAEEIAQLMFYEDLRDVVLVGTSFGGMVCARVAELAPERIARLVFIDAVVPITGETR